MPKYLSIALLCIALTLTVGCAKTLQDLGLSGTKGETGLTGHYDDTTSVTLNALTLTLVSGNAFVNLNVTSQDPAKVFKYRIEIASSLYDFSSHEAWAYSSLIATSDVSAVTVNVVASGSYYVRVRAVNQDGMAGFLSNALKIQIPTMPDRYQVSTFVDDIFARALAIGPDGKLWCAEGGGSAKRLLQYDPEDPENPTIFGTDGKLGKPRAVAVDQNGLVYVGDRSGYQVIRFDPADLTGTLTKFKGNDSDDAPYFDVIYSLSVGSNGIVYAANVSSDLDDSISGIVSFDPTDFSGTVTRYDVGSDYNQSVAYDDVSALVYGADGGIAKFDPTDFDTSFSENVLDFYDTDVITARSGNLYGFDEDAATLFVYNPASPLISFNDPLLDDFNEENDGYALSMAVSQTGVVYLGSDSGILKLVPSNTDAIIVEAIQP